MISCPARVRTTLLRSPMLITRPSVPPTVTISPFFTVRSTSMMRPLTKLFTTFCRPNPIPTPRAPKAILRALRSKPKVSTATKMPRPTRPYRIRVARLSLRVRSTPSPGRNREPRNAATRRAKSTKTATKAMAMRRESAEILVWPMLRNGYPSHPTIVPRTLSCWRVARRKTRGIAPLRIFRRLSPGGSTSFVSVLSSR